MIKNKYNAITLVLGVLLFIFMKQIPAASLNDEERYINLTQQIRCLVCQNQNIQDSNASLAKDLRRKIYALILEKKSDQDIKNYLTKRYGDIILLKPRLNNLTFLLWFFPIIGMLILCYYLYNFFKSQPSTMLK